MSKLSWLPLFKLLSANVGNRMGTPSDLIEAQGTFWDMLRNTGEYDELIKLVKNK